MYEMIRGAALWALVLPATLVAAQDAHREATRLGWVTHYEEGVDQAQESSRPMMIVFRCVP